MGVPDYQTLMLTVLRLTSEGYARVPDMLPVIARDFRLNDEEMSRLLPKGRTTMIASNTHWARTYMSKAGLVRPVKRGHFEVTDRGRALLTEGLSRIDNATLRRFPEFTSWIERSSGKVGEAPDVSEGEPPISEAPISRATPAERIGQARAELEAALADDLLTRLLQSSPGFFEHAVVKLLLGMGYGDGETEAAHLLGAPGDGGIDGIISEDALGLDRVYVQAKRYAPENSVQRPAIQQFVGSLHGEGATKGVFVTTSSFSKGAQDFVGKVSQRIVLIDGQRLARLMIKHGVGVRPVETITLSEIDENFFSED